MEKMREMKKKAQAMEEEGGEKMEGM
jgi:hypothetical protein